MKARSAARFIPAQCHAYDPAYAAPPALPFAWGCLIRDRYHFTYLYGPTAMVYALAHRLMPGQFLHRGAESTLETATGHALAAASEMQRLYGDAGGSGQARPVEGLYNGQLALADLIDPSLRPVNGRWPS